MFLAVAIFYGMFLSIAAILLEEISFRRYPGWIDLTKLLAYSILENFGYRQLLSRDEGQGVLGHDPPPPRLGPACSAAVSSSKRHPESGSPCTLLEPSASDRRTSSARETPRRGRTPPGTARV